jgi:hypothetical protein
LNKFGCPTSALQVDASLRPIKSNLAQGQQVSTYLPTEELKADFGKPPSRKTSNLNGVFTNNPLDFDMSHDLKELGAKDSCNANAEEFASLTFPAKRCCPVIHHGAARTPQTR